MAGAAEQERSRQRTLGILALFGLTAVWGTTFVVIKGAVATLLPGSLILARFGLAGLALLPIFGRHARSPGAWRAGLELGGLSWLGYTTQAIGMTSTSASRSAFITSLSVMLVPALAGLAGRRVARRVYAAAALALLGVGLLSWDGLAPGRGELWTLACALTYAVYVLRLETAARSLDTRALVLTQIWGVLPFALIWSAFEARQAGAGQVQAASFAARSGLPLPLAELAAGLPAHWLAVPGETWLAVAYLALAATALATSLQTYGQRRVGAPEAALIYTSEPVWAALLAGLVLGERLGGRGWLGAGLILVATVFGQWRPATDRTEGAGLTEGDPDAGSPVRRARARR